MGGDFFLAKSESRDFQNMRLPPACRAREVTPKVQEIARYGRILWDNERPKDCYVAKDLKLTFSNMCPARENYFHADEELGLAENWDMVLEANYSLLGLTGSKSLG